MKMLRAASAWAAGARRFSVQVCAYVPPVAAPSLSPATAQSSVSAVQYAARMPPPWLATSTSGSGGSPLDDFAQRSPCAESHVPNAAWRVAGGRRDGPVGHDPRVVHRARDVDQPRADPPQEEQRQDRQLLDPDRPDEARRAVLKAQADDVAEHGESECEREVDKAEDAEHDARVIDVDLDRHGDAHPGADGERQRHPVALERVPPGLGSRGRRSRRRRAPQRAAGTPRRP